MPLDNSMHHLAESTNQQCSERLLSGLSGRCAYQAGILMFIPGSVPGTYGTAPRRDSEAEEREVSVSRQQCGRAIHP